jgi:hypothetical protein
MPRKKKQDPWDMREFDTPINVDIRTGAPIDREKPKVADKKDIVEKQRQKLLYKTFIEHPAYPEFRKQAFQSCYCPPPANINSLITWLFASAMRTGISALFDAIEQTAKSPLPEEQPVVNKYRPSFFSDNTVMPESENP